MNIIFTKVLSKRDLNSMITVKSFAAPVVAVLGSRNRLDLLLDCSAPSSRLGNYTVWPQNRDTHGQCRP